MSALSSVLNELLEQPGVCDGHHLVDGALDDDTCVVVSRDLDVVEHISNPGL